LQYDRAIAKSYRHGILSISAVSTRQHIHFNLKTDKEVSGDCLRKKKKTPEQPEACRRRSEIMFEGDTSRSGFLPEVFFGL
jgi:hypothetical protein